jgi:hypothetical protein
VEAEGRRQEFKASGAKLGELLSQKQNATHKARRGPVRGVDSQTHMTESMQKTLGSISSTEREREREREIT